EEISMLDLANKIVNTAGSSSRIELIPYDVAYEEGFEDMQRRVPDTARAEGMIGFRPTVSLDEIIEQVIAEQRG
ncbi:MAG: nucleoside-diphosphate sugar epimerase, partial [Actinomycetota bacterium]